MALQRSAGNRAVAQLLSSPEAAGGAGSPPRQHPHVRQMEGAFGRTVPDLTVRTDPGAASRASSLGADAYTEDAEIGLAEHAAAPESAESLRGSAGPPRT